MLSLTKILLPTDFSEPALEATAYAVELAKQFGSQLHLLHVIVDPKIYLPMFESVPLPSRDDFEGYAQARLESWILPDDATGIEISCHWCHGTPFVEIARFARSQEVDLMVVGSHGHGFAKHLLMGSVAEKLVRKSPCPVLTVRPKGHQFVHPATD